MSSKVRLIDNEDFDRSLVILVFNWDDMYIKWNIHLFRCILQSLDNILKNGAFISTFMISIVDTARCWDITQQ